MTGFQSYEELFQAVRDLLGKLELGGHHQAAAELRNGFQCLNGLTDGWALFLDSIENVRSSHSKRFDPEERCVLEAIRKAVRFAVYRR